MNTVIDLSATCGQRLMGLWSIDESQLRSMVRAVMNGAVKADTPQQRQARAGRPAYHMAGDTAVVSIAGPMTKHEHSFQESLGGTSTVNAQRAVRAAVADEAVGSILLLVDSPGGMTAGSFDLADDVRAADAAKPVYAYIQDLGASAAYNVASQARKVFGNANASVGSIGTYAVLEDSSEKAKAEGVEVRVVRSSGATHKAIGTPGEAVTDGQLAEVQRHVDQTNDLFIQNVARGRAMTVEQARRLADGSVHVGQHAVDLGLMDGVQTIETTLEMLQQETPNMANQTVPDPIAAFAANHPEHVKSWKEAAYQEGYDQAKSDELARAKALASQYGDRPKFALEQFLAGHSVREAKAELSDTLAAELAETRKELEAQRKKAAVLASNPDLKYEGHPFVKDSEPQDTPPKPNGSDPGALAAWEWDYQEGVKRKIEALGKDKAFYTRIRVSEISGRSKSSVLAGLLSE